MKRMLLAVLLVCLLLPLGAQAQAKAAWTIIYFSDGDTDLEPFNIADLMEMQIVGSTNQVNIVMEMDRVDGYDDTNGTWTDARRFLVQKGDAAKPSSGDFKMDREAYIANLKSLSPEDVGLTQGELDDFIDQVRKASDTEFEELMLQDSFTPGGNAKPQALQQTAVEKVKEPNMGDPKHLTEFATWAIKTYPASHYMLIIGDHGGGWTGVSFDETSGGDGLTMTELASSLADTVAATGIDKFDIVAFDACLMGQLEVYNILAPYAQYAIAAEETIPGMGWEYVTPLKALTQNPSITAVDFGKSVVDGYMDYYTNVAQGYDAFDLHLIDLSQIDGVNKALDQFLAVVNDNPSEDIEAIGFARTKAQGFTQDDPDAAAYFSSVDLADFMKKLKGYSKDKPLMAAAEAVIQASHDAVVYGNSSKALPGATGMAIYFPANADDYALGDNNTSYPEQAGEVMAPWISFLDVFHGTAETVYAPAKTGLKIDITQVIPSDYSASIHEPPSIIFDTDGTGIVDMQFYASLKIADGTYVIVDASALNSAEYSEDGVQEPPFPEGPDTSYYQWEVESPFVADKSGNVELITLISNKDNPDVSTVSGLYRTKDGKETEAYIVFDDDTQTMQSVFGVKEGMVGQSIGEIKVRPGDTFEPYYLVLDDAGKIDRQPSGTQLVFSNEPFKYDYYPAPSGDYRLAIWLEDIAGNIAQDTTEFNIDNEGLDTSLHGFVDIDSGITFLYPWGWPSPTTTLYNDGGYKIELQDTEGTQFIGVDIFDKDYGVTSLDDLIANGQGYIDGFGKADDPEAVSVGYEGYEYDGAVIPYSYTGDDGKKRVGWLVLVYSDDNQLGFQIDIDVRAKDQEAGEQLLKAVEGSIFFNPVTDTNGS